MTTKNLEEIVDQVVEWLMESPVEAQTEFLNCKKEELIQYHYTLGRSIRNEFELWLLDWKPQIEDGIDVSPTHPDAISMSIINEVWERLHENR